MLNSAMETRVRFLSLEGDEEGASVVAVLPLMHISMAVGIAISDSQLGQMRISTLILRP